jgi:hypothetical protein
VTGEAHALAMALRGATAHGVVTANLPTNEPTVAMLTRKCSPISTT